MAGLCCGGATGRGCAWAREHNPAVGTCLGAFCCDLQGQRGVEAIVVHGEREFLLKDGLPSFSGLVAHSYHPSCRILLHVQGCSAHPIRRGGYLACPGHGALKWAKLPCLYVRQPFLWTRCACGALGDSSP